MNPALAEGTIRLAEGSRRGVGLPRVGVAARRVEQENRASDLGAPGIVTGVKYE